MLAAAAAVPGGEMKAIAIVTTAVLGLAAAGVAQASEALAKSSGCMNCHDAATKKVGPSFKESAAKFKGKANAEADIVAKLSDDKKHPANKASADDRKALAKWILSM
jgi:cytochrome c